MPLTFTPEEAEHGPKYVEKIIDEFIAQKNPPGPDAVARAVAKAFIDVFVKGLEAGSND